MRKHLNKVLLAAGFLTPFVNPAQVKDAGLWVAGTAEYNFSLELSAELTEELRFNENISELGTHFTDMGVSYKLLKGLVRPSFHYRFVHKRRVDDTYSKRHRWYFDLALRKKAGPFDLSIRSRYQSQYTDVFVSEDGVVPDLTWRNKITVRFDTEKKLVPYISAELFTNIRNRINENVRFSAGLGYKLNNMHEFGAFFMHQREFNVTNPYWDYIWGLNYSVALDYLIGKKTE
ncbi:MAG: DUF2490 domain-containing protein [Bacteroidia bacterium]|nr:DUF2490 domain-containing protein [Bacteroidia bacterium]